MFIHIVMADTTRLAFVLFDTIFKSLSSIPDISRIT